MPRPLALIAALAALLPACATASDGTRAAERERMVRAVSNLVATSGAREGTELSPSVLNALRRVPRHLFVPEEIRADAYRDQPLPIGHGATISAPSIVALMTELLELREGHRVLEVGTGSGYQAAVLAELGAEVFSIEIVEPLAASASARLADLGYESVTVRAGDGYAGWPEEAPFDRIIVTAAAPHLPQPLVDQLRPGGRMVIPVARGDGEQLMLIEKDRSGRVRSREILPVRFVPLVRGQ
ncbi:MAG: protein-L-isoaspartate(D-aspartate) O-methyltransferase [Pseudomonadota bacterium]|nr:protein-L-isoaspartate(D-aspartate) O-methyltransferase [Pseudomonadota bacterium]